MKYDAKIEDAVRQIRAAVKDLPKGDRLLIENKLDRISSQTKRAIRRGAWKPDEPVSESYTPTNAQIADRYNAQKAVMQAMIGGRKISFLDSKEFEVSQMHTTITKIRKRIEEKKLPYILCDENFTFGVNNAKRGKRYWMIPKEEDGLC